MSIPRWVEQLEPYKPGKPISELAEEKQLERIVKLASNENPLGPSPRAIVAVNKYISGCNRYVDPCAAELIRVIAKKYNKKPVQIVCGHGVDSLLTYFMLAFTQENDEVLTSSGTFIGIYVNTKKTGRNLSMVPLKGYKIDLDAIQDNISSKTRIIYLANPNNPTGTIFPRSRFEAFMETVPQNILVLLDEAYTDYIPPGVDTPNGMDYEYDNLIVTRSFSKCFGLAGLRVGFACGPEELVGELRKVKLPFEPNCCAQAAAMAAMNDDEFLARTTELNRKSLALMKAKFDQLGIRRIDTHANFMLLLMPTEEIAENFCQECLNHGLILRPVKPFGIPNGIRINSGTEEETDFALDVIEKVYAKLLHSSMP